MNFTGAKGIKLLNTTVFYPSADGTSAICVANSTGTKKIVVDTINGRLVFKEDFDMIDNRSRGTTSARLSSFSASVYIDGANVFMRNLTEVEKVRVTGATGNIAIGLGAAAGEKLVVSGNQTLAGWLNYGADVGTTDTYVITIANFSLMTGMPVYFKANTTNDGACSLNVTATGAKALKALNDTDPAANYIEASQVVHCVYDGTNFVLISPDSNP
jgi:hypothetical protein